MEAEYEFEAAVPEEAKVLLAERLQMRGAPFFPLPPVEGEKRLVHSDIDTPSLPNQLTTPSTGGPMEPPPSALATANTYHDHMVDFVGSELNAQYALVLSVLRCMHGLILSSRFVDRPNVATVTFRRLLPKHHSITDS